MTNAQIDELKRLFTDTIKPLEIGEVFHKYLKEYIRNNYPKLKLYSGMDLFTSNYYRDLYDTRKASSLVYGSNEFLRLRDNLINTYWNYDAFEKNGLRIDYSVSFEQFILNNQTPINIIYKDLYQFLIDGLYYMYSEFRKMIYDKLSLDSNNYDIEFYKTFNYNNPFVNDNITNKIFETSGMNDHFYEPFILIRYDNIVLNNKTANTMLYRSLFDNQGHNSKLSRKYIVYRNNDYDFIYRTIIVPSRNFLTYNLIDDTKIEKLLYKKGTNIEVYSIIHKNFTDFLDNSRNIKDEIDIRKESLPDELSQVNDFVPYAFYYGNILNTLTVTIRDKKTNNFVLIFNINDSSKKFKVVNECLGFNDCIDFKAKMNSNGIEITNSDDADQLAINKNTLKKLQRDRNSRISNVKESLYKKLIKFLNSKLKDFELFKDYVNLFIHYDIDYTTIPVEYYPRIFKGSFKLVYQLPRWYEIFTVDNKSWSINNILFSRLGFNTIYTEIDDSLNKRLCINKHWLLDNLSLYRLDRSLEKRIKELKTSFKNHDPEIIWIPYLDQQYEFLYKDYPINQLLEYIYNTLIDESYKMFIENYKLNFDNELEEEYKKEVTSCRSIIREITERYKFGGNAKRGMKKIQKYNLMENLMNEINFYYTSNLNLQMTCFQMVY